MIGSKENAFLLQVWPHASQPMQSSGDLTDANIFADSSSSTSAGASTPWAQIFIQRPQPMHFSGSTALTNLGVHSFRPRVSPVTYAILSKSLSPFQAISIATLGTWRAVSKVFKVIALRSQGGGVPCKTFCNLTIASAMDVPLTVFTGCMWRPTSFAAAGPPI